MNEKLTMEDLVLAEKALLIAKKANKLFEDDVNGTNDPLGWRSNPELHARALYHVNRINESINSAKEKYAKAKLWLETEDPAYESCAEFALKKANQTRKWANDYGYEAESEDEMELVKLALTPRTCPAMMN